MMPSREKIIWFKKAKCAGTSFELLLQKTGAIYYVDKDTKRSDLENDRIKVICIRGGVSPNGMSVKRETDGSYVMTRSSIFDRFLRRPFEPKEFMINRFPDILEKYHKFAIVRNPYDKFVSSWKYLKSTKEREIEYVLDNLPSRKHFHDWLHISKKQVDFVFDRGRALINQAVYMEDHFQDEIDEIILSIGLAPELLPRKNATNRNSYLDYLTPIAKEKILNLYKDDFDVFGYSYDEAISKPINRWKPILS